MDFFKDFFLFMFFLTRTASLKNSYALGMIKKNYLNWSSPTHSVNLRNIFKVHFIPFTHLFNMWYQTNKWNLSINHRPILCNLSISYTITRIFSLSLFLTFLIANAQKLIFSHFSFNFICLFEKFIHKNTRGEIHTSRMSVNSTSNWIVSLLQKKNSDHVACVAPHNAFSECFQWSWVLW